MDLGGALKTQGIYGVFVTLGYVGGVGNKFCFRLLSGCILFVLIVPLPEIWDKVMPLK